MVRNLDYFKGILFEILVVGIYIIVIFLLSFLGWWNEWKIFKGF